MKSKLILLAGLVSSTAMAANEPTNLSVGTGCLGARGRDFLLLRQDHATPGPGQPVFLDQVRRQRQVQLSSRFTPV